jgi:hypothetical protein
MRYGAVLGGRSTRAVRVLYNAHEGEGRGRGLQKTCQKTYLTTLSILHNPGWV